MENRNVKDLMGSSITMTVLATAIVALRVGIKKSRMGRLELDDWLIVACLPLLYAVTTTAFLAIYLGGMGNSLEVILQIDYHILVRSLQCLFAVELLYATLILLAKLSILAMYRQIFPTSFVMVGSYILGGIVLVWWIAVMLVTVLQCRPLPRLWDIFVSEGTCMDRIHLFIGNAIPNIITDVLILGLPVSEVMGLQMSLSKKLGISGMFLLGGIVCVISGLRLRSGLILLSDADADFNLSIGPLWAWTVVEPAMAIICACLPSVGPQCVLRVKKLLPSSKARNETIKNGASHKTIATIGGGSGRPINRLSKLGDNGTRSFERLDDDPELGAASTPGLWPKGYHAERSTTVSGRYTPNEQGPAIPLTSISVTQEMSWDESRVKT